MSSPSIFSYDHPTYPLHITVNVILTTLLTVISAVATMIADPSIQGELALSNTETVWITTLYLLGVNTVVPTGNWFANQFGFNRMYTYGVVIFTAATLLSAVANNFFLVAMARFIGGIGAGFIFPIGLALIAKSVSKAKIALAINLYVGIGIGVGLGVGALLAGYLSQFVSWRAIFLVIVPFGIVSSISCWLCRNKKAEVSKTPFDFPGFISLTTCISTLLIALVLAPIRATPEGWRTPYIVALLITSFFALLALIYFEKRSKAPLFPLSLFKNPLFSASLPALFLLGMTTFASIAVSVEYMLGGLFYEKFVTGKIAAVYGFAFGLFSIVANLLLKWIPVPVLTFTGITCLIVSFFYNNELSWLTGYKQMVAILILRGIGVGLSLGPTTLMALYGVSPELKASAATTLTFFRQIGGTYGGTLISIFSIRRTIFHTARFAEGVNPQLSAYKSTLRNLLDKYPDPVKAKLAIVENIQTQARIQGINDALIVVGYVMIVVAISLLILLVHRKWKAAIGP